MSIRSSEVQDIVAGRVTSWSQVPGSPRSDPIVPVALDPTTGGAQVFQTVLVDDATPVLYHPVTLAADAQMRDYIEQTPAAFGYVDLALTGPLHVARYNGVGCTRATIRAATYPASRPLGVVARCAPRRARPVPALGANQPPGARGDRHALRDAIGGPSVGRMATSADSSSRRSAGAYRRPMRDALPLTVP